MFIQLTAPSKTFILGEYLVTQGGEALLCNTTPCFQLQVTQNNLDDHMGFDPHCPAGKFMQKQCDVFNTVQLDFTDPHQGMGGFGASSAQFLMVHALAKLLKHKQKYTPDFGELLADYKSCAWDGTGIAPSGADVISQLTGGLASISIKNNSAQAMPWPFPNLEFYLIHTGNKIATHKHLKQLDTVPVDDLQIIFQQGLQALKNKKESAFIVAVNAYGKTLTDHGLCLPETQELLKQCQQPFILASKGCGALGADVIFVLIEKQNKLLFEQFAKEKQFNIIATSNNLSHGLQISQQHEAAA